MLKQMNAQYIVSFEPKGAIKDKQQLIQEMLSSYFPPASYSVIGLPVNATVPPEIPRMLAVSPFGHSTLQISESELRMQTNFDAQFNEDHVKCWEYFKERVDQLNELARCISGHRLLFAGIVAQFFDEDVENPSAFVRDKYFTNALEPDVFDISARVTYVREERYYLNLIIDNLRDDEDPNKEALGVKVDINSRYAVKPRTLRYMDDELLAGVQTLYMSFVKKELTKVIEKR